MENKTIQAFEKLIALKDETIKELERQIQLLKDRPPIYIPSFPSQPYQPLLTFPINPQYPWYNPQPYIVTSGATAMITNDPNTTCTLTNSDGITNVIDFNKISRA